VLIDGYLRANRLDDGFRLAATWIEKNPTDVGTITHIALLGTDQVKKGDQKYVDQSQQCGIKAIDLIESNTRGKLTDEQWNEYKVKWLPNLYQAVGITMMVKQNPAEAKIRFQKAASLNAADPLNWVMLGQLLNTRYQEMAQRFKGMTAGPARDELLKEIQALMDELIDNYAHAVAVASADLQYKQLHDQVLEDLTAYYKWRHNGTAGLQPLIDKYKRPPASQ
jgi:hypothetical protein